MSQVVTVTSQGQVYIPAKLRRNLPWGKTRQARIEAVGERIIIEPIKDVRELRGILRTSKRVSGHQVRQQFEQALARGEA